MSETPEKRHMEVYSIREYTQDKQLKNHWTRLGVAFENKDGSWNLRLHALPVTNPKSGLAELHMREPRPAAPPDQEAGQAFGRNPPHAANGAGVQDGFHYDPDVPMEHLY